MSTQSSLRSKPNRAGRNSTKQVKIHVAKNAAWDVLDEDTQKLVVASLVGDYIFKQALLLMRRLSKALRDSVNEAVEGFMTKVYKPSQEMACLATWECASGYNDSATLQQSEVMDARVREHRRLSERAFGSRHGVFQLISGTDVHAYLSALTHTCIYCRRPVELHAEQSLRRVGSATSPSLAPVLSPAEVIGACVHQSCMSLFCTKVPGQVGFQPVASGPASSCYARCALMATGWRYELCDNYTQLSKKYRDCKSQLQLSMLMVENVVPPRLKHVRLLKTSVRNIQYPTPHLISTSLPYVYNTMKGIDPEETVERRVTHAAALRGIKGNLADLEARGNDIREWRIALKDSARGTATERKVELALRRMRGINKWMKSMNQTKQKHNDGMAIGSEGALVGEIPWTSIGFMETALPNLSCALPLSEMQEVSAYAARNSILAIARSILPIYPSTKRRTPTFFVNLAL